MTAKLHRSVHEGQNNAFHMAVHRDVLGGPLVVGNLYRVKVSQGENHEINQAIMEYAGQGPDPIATQEIVYTRRR